MANYLHQPVILMAAGSYTFSSHFTWTGVWGRSPQPPEARGSGKGVRNPQRLAIWGDLLSK